MGNEEPELAKKERAKEELRNRQGNRILQARHDAAEAEVERVAAEILRQEQKSVREMERQEEFLSRLTTGKRRLASRICDDHDDQIPPGFTDIIGNETRIGFSWKERLKILFGAGMVIETCILTEKKPGRMETRQEVSTVFPRRRSRRPPECYTAVVAGPDSSTHMQEFAGPETFDQQANPEPEPYSEETERIRQRVLKEHGVRRPEPESDELGNLP